MFDRSPLLSSLPLRVTYPPLLPYPKGILYTYLLYYVILQAAVYGIGVCAEFGGSVFRPLVGGILANSFGRLLFFTVLTCSLINSSLLLLLLVLQRPFPD